jgi:hypothetical protein
MKPDPSLTSDSHFLQGIVKVRLEPQSSPRLLRVFTILKDRIEQRCPVQIIANDMESQIILGLGADLSADAFRIAIQDEAVHVYGGSPLGLLYGVGKFLRTGQYANGFHPSSKWQGTSAPQGSLRGMYLATHFHNWYHVASPAEITRYLEDLALWGTNTIMAVFPMINLQDWDDPQTGPALEMLREIASSAHGLGLQFATALNNTMFKGAPADIRAVPLPDPTGRRGNSGHPVCPSLPAGYAYLMENARILFERLSDVGLDLLVHWPYDEGGCACSQCQPWGSNGYLRLSRDLTCLGRQFFPNLRTVLSTWMFDTPPEGEWQGLAAALARDNTWLDIILADSHEDFPRYPLENGVPGDLPLVNFPEISMWGNWPWGGVGANPLPARFQRLWNQVRHLVRGGFPYSEGIYEDLNKAVVTQFYWDPDRSAIETLSEYFNYEFNSLVVEDTLEMIGLLEGTAGNSYLKQPVDLVKVERAYHLAHSIQPRLSEFSRQNWRWEILSIRALLDYERFVRGSLESSQSQAALQRLIEIYHSQLVTDDPYHHRVRPRLKGATTIGFEL